jgi:hypothetical protein
MRDFIITVEGAEEQVGIPAMGVTVVLHLKWRRLQALVAVEVEVALVMIMAEVEAEELAY